MTWNKMYLKNKTKTKNEKKREKQKQKNFPNNPRPGWTTKQLSWKIPKRSWKKQCLSSFLSRTFRVTNYVHILSPLPSESNLDFFIFKKDQKTKQQKARFKSTLCERSNSQEAYTISTLTTSSKMQLVSLSDHKRTRHINCWFQVHAMFNTHVHVTRYNNIRQ